MFIYKLKQNKSFNDFTYDVSLSKQFVLLLEELKAFQRKYPLSVHYIASPATGYSKQTRVKRINNYFEGKTTTSKTTKATQI